MSVLWGTRWRSRLRHFATNRKVVVSIPSGVTGIFHWRDPSCRAMTLGSTQPITKMSTRNISWGGVAKCGRWVGLKILPPFCVECHEIWEPGTPVTLRACPCLYRDCFTFSQVYCTYTYFSFCSSGWVADSVMYRIKRKLHQKVF
jgi:hypothetical protein